jgi:hypothetical protein
MERHRTAGVVAHPVGYIPQKSNYTIILQHSFENTFRSQKTARNSSFATLNYSTVMVATLCIDATSEHA